MHRNLKHDEVEMLRARLAELVPQAHAEMSELIRTMRFIVRKSQAEYARLCGVSPRVLADIEAGKGVQTTETLAKLLRPFGFELGVVAPPSSPSN